MHRTIASLPAQDCPTEVSQRSITFSLALVPLVALAATGAWAIVWIGGGQRAVALREGKAATPA